MIFFADEMLGKLARWLRMNGHDVLYLRRIADDDLLKTAFKEKRVILTRDTRLIKRLRPQEYLFISHDYLEDQIQEFYGNFPQVWEKRAPLSRCVECNTPLQSVKKETIKGKVWPYVYQNQKNFTQCPGCEKVYWKATHVQRIEDRLKRFQRLISP